jgi:hypothetical protein
MTRNQLSVLGAAVLVAAGATTLALWPNGPAPQSVQSPAPVGATLAQSAVEVCDQSDGGDGTCRIC